MQVVTRPTLRANLVLLCDSHHRAQHHGDYAIYMVDGRPIFERADACTIDPAPTLAVVPPPPDDLLVTSDQGLGPIEGHWDGQPIDRDWVLTGFALQRQQRIDRLAEAQVS